MPNIYKLQKARKTIIEILNDRGYKIKYEAIDLAEEYAENNCKIICSHKSDEDKKICILFYDNNNKTDSKVGIDIVKDLLKKIDEDQKHIMLVLSSKITPYALKEVKKNPVEIEIFYINNIIFNITKHELMPKFTLLNKSEQDKMIEKFKNHLPLIKSTDKICHYFNAKPGQIFKIIRKNGDLYYRMVVS